MPGPAKTCLPAPILLDTADPVKPFAPFYGLFKKDRILLQFYRFFIHGPRSRCYNTFKEIPNGMMKLCR